MSSPNTSGRSTSGQGRSGGSSGRRSGGAGAARSGAPRGDRRGAGSAPFYSSTSAGASTGSVFSTGAFAASIPATGTDRPRSADGDRRGRSEAPRTDRPARGDRSARPARTGDAPRTERPARGERPARTEGGQRPARQGGQVNSRGRGGRRNAAVDDRTPVTFAAGTPHASQRPATEPVTAGSLFAAAKTIKADAAPVSDVTFAELGVPEKLIKPLAALGALSPFPIQAATLPVSLTGRDVLGRGRTGSGKTIAFAVPLVARLTGGRRTPNRPRGLVLLPTRELALQVARTIEPLATAAGLKTVTIFGGVGFGPQTTALRAGVDIVIACPGRLEDLIKQGVCNLGDVDVTVLDEADHMADLGFLPGVRRLLRATRPNGQRLLFSATLDNGISVLVNDFLTDPAVHAVDDATSHVETMTHHVFAVSKDDRNEVIRQLALGGGRRMLFTRTKFGAKKWAAALSKNGIPAVDLHGNLSQNARERNLAAFSTGSAKVLVATDIAARGIHVDDVELVVHLDPPTEHKAYLHRSGRTARAGAGGTVITVMLPEQGEDVRKLMKLAGISATTTAVRPGHPAIVELAG
ncbi:Superfamily II DNA and RNA helicase [Nakamurella panacisegetis]|uniref:Superfamily II DNA and RNA helicase n=1 Tax=Nakamurella panacisegetis TaxID=1090615 RepID=A0A1H0NKA7_9ACTN|nr:DEAD/DEAH box helicase [Nakamurella panacisegetis]SDO93134.1 Superfamily II DNA and RNA helicase [Nakamurella panacisegetis]